MTQTNRRTRPASTPATAPARVQVRLLCILSGDGESWGPGEVVTVDADEAERLIALGAAMAT
jgi:hypothetical protein